MVKKDTDGSGGSVEQVVQVASALEREMLGPLSTISALCQLVVEHEEASESVRKSVNVIQEYTRSLVRSVRNLIEFAALDADDVLTGRRPFSVRSLLARVGETGAAAFDHRNQVFVSHVDDTIPEWVSGAEAPLARCLEHLLENASRFTPPGGGVALLVLSGGVREEATCNLEFYVTDSGIGIPAHLAGVVKLPFVSGDMTYARREGGFGLGLSSAIQLVNLLGGSLTVESVSGRGTRISFSLAFERSTAPDAGVEVVAQKPPLEISALVVDDNAINRKVLAGMLSREGVRVTVACSGSEAIALCELEQFGVVFMDINMPVMDGVQATEVIRRRETSVSHRSVIVATTTVSDPREIDTFIEAGMDEYLAKPIEPNRLREILNRFRATLR